MFDVLFMNRFFEFKKVGLTKQDFLDADKDIDLSNLEDDFCIHSLAPLDDAKNGDLSFFTITLVSGNKYYRSLENTNASFCILKKQYSNINKKLKLIFSDEPYITFMRLCDKLMVKTKVSDDIEYHAGQFNNSIIGKGTHIGNGTTIDEFVKIGDGVVIGENCIIKSGVKIGDNCVIGSNCIICENCVIQYAEIGNNCCIQTNVAIGQDGFGYSFDRRTGLNEKINHFGYVKIGNNVDIGANSCIDRGVFNATIIEDNVKIGNLVQVAHNVKIGNGTMIAGQSGIAGSATIGESCMIGGKCGISGHIVLGKQCILYGATNVSKSFPSHSKIIGTPGMLYHLWINKHFKDKKYKLTNKNKYRSFFSYLRDFISKK